MNHRLDPIHLHHAAAKLAEPLARGDLSWDGVRTICRDMAATAANVDRNGLQARLCWRAADEARALRTRRQNAETAIRWAVRPLMHGATRAQIEEAAGRANGDVLTWDEIKPILAEEWQRAHQARRRG